MNRILLVEDNPINQKVALRLLMLLGYSADVAENGADALLLLDRQHDYAAVLMDLQMPVMDGLTAALAIRGLKGGRSRIPIIALTANSSERDRQRCLAAGMNDFLAKPINKDHFAAALDRWTATQLTA
jgi:CheY-like chemotaxis protein